MILSPIIRKAEFERDDFHEMCLFTGAAVKKTRKGEHVIPDWLIKDYQLRDRRIEMGWPGAIADITMFRTRADPTANGKFGVLEEKIKYGKWSHDTLHLWQKKISVGMILCHWRMAQNKYHPQAPGNFDTRHLVITLGDFREGFHKFAGKQPIPRNGSTLILPTMVPDGWLAHVFGATVVEGETHDAILPFGMLAVTHQNKLIVSVFHDSEREFESSTLPTHWEVNNLNTCVDSSKIAAALAVVYSQFVFKVQTETLGSQGRSFDELLKIIGYQLGLDIDPKTSRYSLRGMT